MAGKVQAFLLIFGVWDIAYYVALHVLVRWPGSLLDMDLLFLIPPHPWWYQPVWVPVLVSCLMIALGALAHRRSVASLTPSPSSATRGNIGRNRCELRRFRLAAKRSTVRSRSAPSLYGPF
jgi:hypothetical protein